MSRHSHARLNPYKFGLLGGLGGFLQGLQNYQDQQAKFSQQTSLAQEKAKNDRLLKLLEMDGNQRGYTVHRMGDDGKPQDVSVRNVYNPKTGTFEPHELGAVPAKDPLAATNALITSREKLAADAEQGRNNRAAAALKAKNDPSVETAAERRNRLLQEAENRRLASKMTQQDVRDFTKADPDQRAQMLAAEGLSDTVPDPDAKTFFGSKKEGATKKDPDVMRKYREARQKQNESALGIKSTDGSDVPAGHTTDHPDKTPGGQPIKYDAQGNAYIKGPDGKPVPYTPTAQDGSADSSLALDSPEAQALAANDPTQQADDQGQDTQGGGLLADEEDQQAVAASKDQPQEEQPQDDKEQNAGILS